MNDNAIENMLYERAIRTKIRAPRPEGQHRLTSLAAVLGVLSLTNIFMTPADHKIADRTDAHAQMNHATLGQTVAPSAPLAVNQSNTDTGLVSIAMSQLGH